MKDSFILIACIVILAMLGFIAWQFVVPTKFVHTPSNQVACTMDARECPDGSFVGRTGPNCEFAACPNGSAVNDSPMPVVEDPVDASDQIADVFTCSPESREAQVCIELYAPVCAQVQVECITTPCNPVPETFSNSCFACANERVLSYTNGACEGPQVF